jgi:hypothetical protein
MIKMGREQNKIQGMKKHQPTNQSINQSGNEIDE